MRDWHEDNFLEDLVPLLQHRSHDFCPDADALAAVADGEASDSVNCAISEHVARCADCARLLKRLGAFGQSTCPQPESEWGATEARLDQWFQRRVAGSWNHDGRGADRKQFSRFVHWWNNLPNASRLLKSQWALGSALVIVCVLSAVIVQRVQVSRSAKLTAEVRVTKQTQAGPIPGGGVLATGKHRANAGVSGSPELPVTPSPLQTTRTMEPTSARPVQRMNAVVHGRLSHKRDEDTRVTESNPSNVLADSKQPSLEEKTRPQQPAGPEQRESAGVRTPPVTTEQERDKAQTKDGDLLVAENVRVRPEIPPAASTANSSTETNQPVSVNRTNSSVRAVVPLVRAEQPSRAGTRNASVATQTCVNCVGGIVKAPRSPVAGSTMGAAHTPPSSIRVEEGTRVWIVLKIASPELNGTFEFRGVLLLPVIAKGKVLIDRDAEVYGTGARTQDGTSIQIDGFVVHGSHYTLKNRTPGTSARSPEISQALEFNAGQVLETWTTSVSTYERHGDGRQP